MSPVVLITGVTSGIGRATAAYLASRQMQVFGTVPEPVDGLQQHPDGYHIMTMDVRDDAAVRQAVGAIMARAGHVDVLVNNAGVGFNAPVEETTIEDARRVFEINTLGPLRVIQAVLPSMRQRRRGLIINTSSIGGQIAIPFDGVYSASKFALEGLSEALSLELLPFGIKVVILEPGNINTSMTLRSSTKQTHDTKSPYFQFHENAYAAAVANEREGSSPLMIARKIEAIIAERKPALRYVGGTLIERLMIPVKHFLPGRLFERLVAREYRLDAAGQGPGAGAQAGTGQAGRGAV